MTIFHRILEEKDPDTEEITKYLDVTTLIENKGAMFDQGLTYKDGHMYQAWIQFKDPAKSVDIDVTFPPREDVQGGQENEKENEKE